VYNFLANFSENTAVETVDEMSEFWYTFFEKKYTNKKGGNMRISRYTTEFVSFVLTMAILSMGFHVSLADTMSSTNYRVQNDNLGVGGNQSSSASFIADDSIGEFAIGEDSTSASFRACAGFECFERIPYLTFTVGEGTASPGTPGTGISLGTITPSGVATSNGSTVNSIFLSTETNALSGVSVTVRSANAALERISSPMDTIPSSSATLVAGTEGYGVCISSTSQDAGSPSSLSASAPYNGSCAAGSHVVGIVDSTNRPIVTAGGEVKSGEAVVMVKAAVSTSTVDGADYSDTLTFVASATF
jgi:hypothetical protein